MTYRYSSEPEPEPSRLASAVARPRALPFSTHRWRKKMQVTRVTTRERALTILPLFPSPRDQETHDSIGYLKQLLFGDGVLADMHNLDRFLGFSSTSHHLTRLACRTSIDAVKGTGWLAERSVYYAIDTSKPIAKDLAVGTVTELQLDVAWEKIAAASVVTWRNLVNVSFLSWTVVRPVVVFVLPFWDMVWNSVEPLLMAAKESAMDSAEDAYFTLEVCGQARSGVSRAKALAPVVRFPGNVLRAFVAVVVRPAVYFCTYPELYGDLEIPEKPVVERLRWGEKCRKMAWSEWGECSVRCGEGYRARVNHCGKREVVRCVGPGVMGCDEICDSGAIRDCAGRCMGRAEVDCAGVCGGCAFGCDGKCTDPPAALDKGGVACRHLRAPHQQPVQHHRGRADGADGGGVAAQAYARRGQDAGGQGTTRQIPIQPTRRRQGVRRPRTPRRGGVPGGDSRGNLHGQGSPRGFGGGTGTARGGGG